MALPMRAAPDAHDEGFAEKVRSSILADPTLTVRPSDTSARQNFYIFFSFDLVNSTLYKTLRPTQWPVVTQRFYEIVEDGLKKHASQVRLWKYVGDELLLYRRIHHPKDIRESLSAAHQTMDRAIKELGKAAADARTILSVKTTLWCALVHELAPRAIEELGAEKGRGETAPRNLLVRQPDAAGQGQIDFLGSDVDTGFRIAKFASRQRMVVSADLAYLLYRDRAADDRLEHQLKIVSYEILKGVWEGRHYPIFWFEPDWQRISGSFGYDEQFQSEIVKRIMQSGPLADLSKIAKIFADVDRTRIGDELWSFVNQDRQEDVELAPIAVAKAGAEVHCVAICFRRDSNEALIAKRPMTKRRFAGHWEFGCGQLRARETFAQCLKRAYADDFGAELAIDERPTPVATFLIPDSEDGTIPGVIFIAEITNPGQLANRNHEEIEWVSSANIREAEFGEAVPNLLENLRKAEAAWRAANGL